MAQLCLSSEGLFPIPHPDSGRSILGLPLSGTLQGEGLLCGVPSLFLRLAGCNLRCLWRDADGYLSPCDTSHALNMENGYWIDTQRLAERVLSNLEHLSHWVITGGEPLLQATSLVDLIDRVRFKRAKNSLHITLETNGTLFCPELAQRIDLISLSPKLNAHRCGYRDPIESYISALQQWLDVSRSPSALQFKFVVSSPTDDNLIDAQYLSKLQAWHSFPLFVMPLGTDPSAMRMAQQAAISIAIRRNWRYTPRLHIDLWGNVKGT